MKTLKALITLLVLGSIFAYSAMAKTGDIHIIPETNWVQVMNPDGIQSSNHFFPFEDTGIAEQGREIIEILQQGNLTLVKINDSNMGGGTTLPGGTLFFVKTSELQKYNDLSREKEQGYQNRKEQLRKMLESLKE